tara:strand:+ start:105 stop:458 length:354 start_codon:yes stop_codon:yes gene_type:complete
MPKSTFIKTDLTRFRQIKNQEIEHICELGVNNPKCGKLMREWYGETETQYFYIRYVCGMLNVSLGDCEMDAKYDYTPIAMVNETVYSIDIDNSSNLIKRICRFLNWKLPPGDVDLML